MKVSKTSDKYLFYQDGENYILSLGEIKKGEDTTTDILFEDVEDIKLLTVKKTCGCTVLDRNEIDKHTLKVSIKYTNCEYPISKTVICQNNKETFKILIKGTCR